MVVGIFKVHVICCFFLFFGAKSLMNAQVKIDKGTINWKLIKTSDSLLHINKTIMYFDFGKIKNDFDIAFVENIVPVDANASSPKFKFLYTSFEVIPDNELQLIDDLSGISDTFSFESYFAIEKKKKQLIYSFLPVRKNKSTGQFERLTHYILEITPDNTIPLKKSELTTSLVENSVLNSGDWFPMKIAKSGIYQIYYNELKDLGIEKPELVKIYGNGGSMLPEIYNGNQPDDLHEIPLSMITGTDGIFNSGDYILFYAQGPVVWKWNDYESWFAYTKHAFTDEITYFITSGESGKHISIVPSPAGTVNKEVTTYDSYDFHEVNLYNLIRSGRDFYGENFNLQTSYDFTFDLTNLVPSENIRIKSEFLARSEKASHISYKYGNNIIKYDSISKYQGYDFGTAKTINSSFLATPGKILINIQFDKRGNTSAEGWLNYIKIWTRQYLKLNNNQLEFCDKNSVGTGNIARFSVENATNQTFIWDISDIFDVKQQTTNLTNTTLSFSANSNSLNTYIAFDYKNGLLRPTIDKKRLDNQNLHAVKDINYIIVAHPDFINQANELANLRTTRDNLSVEVVTPQQIYNEFSSGSPDPAAIRNFAKMIYDKTPTDGKELKYILLYGDGSYDNKSQNSKNTNFILTYQSVNSLNFVLSYVSDDYFGLLDNNENIGSGHIDVGVGRFPVSDTIEANTVLNKLKNYYKQSSLGDWRNVLCFIGDDDDTGGNERHSNEANDLTIYLEKNYSNFNFDKIYLDAFQQVSTSSGQRYPDASKAIYNRLNQGALIMNYTGHGNERGLTSELIIQQTQDINKWTNSIYPIFITATCEFSRYDDYNYQTAGEDILLNPSGGGIALLSTTRLVYSSNNFRLNMEFYKHIFSKDSAGNPISISEAILKTKNALGIDNNKHNFSLLGDPAFVLPYPQNIVKTDSINGSLISNSDTIRAFQKVTISGSITDNSGNKLNSFNGIIYPVVYDKQKKVTTLSNDGEPKFEFTVQKDVLFKGKATIKNGNFSFTFMLPRDINYNYDFGKISYYAKNDNMNDASGNYKDVIIGGLYTSDITDSEGPEIKLFINDSSFTDGGITGEFPSLYAKISDFSGINIGGQGIGHDLVATLDNNLSDPILLNNFYQTNLDNYKDGELTYQLPQMTPGIHTLSLKAWDVLNNSSQKQISFKVLDGNAPVIGKTISYPNPTNGETKFFFEHNINGEILSITIDIYNMAGLPVSEIETTIEPAGFTSGSIPWDGTGLGGKLLPAGIYLYRITLNSSKGSTQSETKKLIITK